MTAPFSDELLSAYLDGELNAEERAYVEAQLRERADLRRLCDELRALRATLQAMPVARPPENFAERVLRQAERQMLAASDSSSEETADDDPPAVEPAEMRQRNWLQDPRWRVGIGVVAGLAACLLAMVVLYPPAAFQNARNVAMSPDAVSHPSEGVTELATTYRERSADSADAPQERNILVRGHDESLGFAENAGAPKSAFPSVEMPAVELAVPSAPNPSSAAPAAPAAAPAPMRSGGETVGPREDFVHKDTGENDSATRRMMLEKADSSKRESAAGASAGSGLLPGAPAGGADSFGTLGERGSMLPGGAMAPGGAGLPFGGGRGGMGGMGGGAGGLGGSMAGGGGSGGQPMPGGGEMRFGKATDGLSDAPADAAPDNAPRPTITYDNKYVYTPEIQPSAPGSPAESVYFSLPLDPGAWAGTPVTPASLEQCTAQLEQARFLLVKVTVPEDTPESSQEESPTAAATESEGDKVVAENLFRKLRHTLPTPLEIKRFAAAEPNETTRVLAAPELMPQQVLVVDASSETIRQSIDQLVSQPDVSVERATDDSALAKQLADQRLGLTLRQQLAEQPELLAAQPDTDHAPQSDGASNDMLKNSDKLDAEGMSAAGDTQSEAGRAEGKLAEKELAKDKMSARTKPALGRPVEPAEESVTTPAPAMPRQDPAPIVDRSAAPPAARSDTRSRDASSAGQDMAGKIAATAPEKGVAKDRVVFYILYRLAPDPAQVAPPAPAEPAGDR